jgi:hypothetical protein
MEAKEKRKLENELLTMGLKGLTDPDLIQQLADLVSQWPGDKHDFLRDLLNECDSGKRYEMYHAIAPRLKFKPLSLPQYESQIALKAGEMVSHGYMRVEGDRPKPIEIGGHKLAVVPQSQATGAVATVRCFNCEASDKFLAETPAGAMIAARKAGWVRDKALNKETCPQCAEKIAAQEVIALSHSEKLIITDHRRVN